MTCPTCGGELYMERDSLIRCHGCPSVFRLVEQAAAPVSVAVPPPAPLPPPSPPREPGESEAREREAVATAARTLDAACRRDTGLTLGAWLLANPDKRVEAMGAMRSLLASGMRVDLAGAALDAAVAAAVAAAEGEIA